MSGTAIANNAKSTLSKSILVLFPSWVFAFLLGVLLHEIGHAIGYIIIGQNDIVIYLHPFDLSYTEVASPTYDQLGLTFVKSMGSLHNVFWASVVTLSLWKKRDQFLLPIVMWGPVAYITEAVAILSQFSSWGDWYIVAQSTSDAMVIALGVIFLSVGILMALLILSVVYDVPKTELWKRLMINGLAIPIWYIVRAIYAAFMITNVGPLYPILVLFEASMIAAIVSVGAVIILTILHKPIFPKLEQISHTDTRELEWKAVWLSMGLAAIMILIFTLTPYVPPY
jgi:hypothetical protein